MTSVTPRDAFCLLLPVPRETVRYMMYLRRLYTLSRTSSQTGTPLHALSRRVYCESNREYHHVLPYQEVDEYPYGPLESKIKVLQLLVDQFVTTNIARDELMSNYYFVKVEVEDDEGSVEELEEEEKENWEKALSVERFADILSDSASTSGDRMGRNYTEKDFEYAPTIPSVSVSPSAEIEEGSSVTLTCSSDANPAANYTWYKRNNNSDLPPLSEGQRLVFRSIQSSDSGQYYCTAENELGTKTSENIFIDVKYAPKPPSVSVSPSAEIEEGSSVTLTCSSDANPAANHTWYKDETSYSSILNEEPQFVFGSMQASDSGKYFCSAENTMGRRTSEKLFIDVKCE
nr:PREDICTED: B-cell receptor CD22-like [Notothenia coriiceps]